MDAFDVAAVSYQIVLTKADKLKPAEVGGAAGPRRGGHRAPAGRLPARAGGLRRHRGGVANCVRAEAVRAAMS